MAELHSLRQLSTRSRVSEDSTVPNVDTVELTAPILEETVQAPTQRYQILLLASGFLMTFIIIGINSVFGIFQEFYTSRDSNIVDAKNQDALVSLVGSIGSGLTWGGSIFVNPMIARVQNLKYITITGAIMMSAGLLGASFSTKLWHLYLTQSLLWGIGSSMMYFPIMSITPVYFNRHRGAAMGLILAGSGVGGLTMAPVLRHLIDAYGINWALRIFAIWAVVVAVPTACVVQHRHGFGAKGPTRLNTSLVTQGTFIYQAIGAFLQAAGNVVPMYYLTSYSTSVLLYPRSTGSLLLAINSGVNSLSRVAMGILADRAGRQNTMIGSIALSAVSVFALWYDAPRSRFIAFVVLYGIYAGGYNALLPTIMTEIYGVQNYASANGFLYFIRGLGAIAGAPLAGLILGSHKRGAASAMDLDGAGLGHLKSRYHHVVLYDGFLLLAAGFCVCSVRWLDARDKGVWKWKA